NAAFTQITCAYFLSAAGTGAITTQVTNTVGTAGTVTIRSASAPTVTSLRHAACSDNTTDTLGAAVNSLVGCLVSGGSAGILTISFIYFYGAGLSVNCFLSRRSFDLNAAFTQITCAYFLSAAGTGAITTQVTNTVGTAGTVTIRSASAPTVTSLRHAACSDN